MNVNLWNLVLAGVVLTLALSSTAYAQSATTDIVVDPEDVRLGRKEYSPYLDRGYPQRVFWGDTHLFAEPQQIPVVSDGAMNSEQSGDAFSQFVWARGAGPSTSQAASRRSSRHEFVFSTRPGVWFPKLDTEFSLENNAGLATELDLDDLDADDRDTAFNGRVNLRLGSHDVWLGGWTYAASGTTVASGQIIFGNLTIPVGDTVKTEFDIQVIGLRYGYSFFSFERNGFRLGPMLGVNYFDLESSLEAVNLNREESEDEQVPAPEVGAHFEIPLADFLISTDISGLYLSTDDFDATFLDIEATLTWRPPSFSPPRIDVISGPR